MPIAGEPIAMLGSRILQIDASVQDAFVEMIDPAGAWWIVSPIGALYSLLAPNIGESIMVPFWSVLLPRSVCYLKIAETNSKTHLSLPVSSSQERALSHCSHGEHLKY